MLGPQLQEQQNNGSHGRTQSHDDCNNRKAVASLEKIASDDRREEGASTAQPDSEAGAKSADMSGKGLGEESIHAGNRAVDEKAGGGTDHGKHRQIVRGNPE